MKIDNIDFGWFDLVVVAAVIVGALRGRKRGMSEELLDLLKWLAIVIVGGLFYRPLGQLLFAQIPVLNRTIAFVLAYVAIGLCLHLVMSFFKRGVGEKLVQSEVFGDLEYYLGIMAGVVRFSCVLLAVLALLNAKYISDADRAANARMQRENFGSISFPTLGSLQQDVFHESWTGQQIKRYAGQLLIDAGPEPGRNRENIGRRRERAVDEIMNPR